MNLKVKVGLWTAYSQRRINTKALESKERLHRLWVIMKQKNIHRMRSLEEEEREEGVESFF